MRAPTQLGMLHMSRLQHLSVVAMLPLVFFLPTFPHVRAQTEGDTGDSYLDAYDYDDPDIEPVLGREPSFDVPVVNVTVVAGQIAMLPCSIEALGKYKITWTDQNKIPLTFEDRKIVDDTRFSVVRERTSEWTLMIRDVTWEDRGEYRCTINTNPVRNKLVVLHVKVPATIIDELSSDDMIVKENDTVLLVCNVTGIPRPTVTWYRQSVTSRGVRPKKKLQSQGEMLMIQNISRNCDSYYLCEADNGIPPKVTRQMKVTVEFAPEVRLKNYRIGQKPHKDTILECQITAYPMTINYWQKDGRQLSSSTKYRLDAYDEQYHTITLSLRIMDLDESDYGEYVCGAENRLGADKGTMKLYQIQSKPAIVPVFPIAPKTGANIPFPGGTPLPSNGQVVPRLDTDKYNVQKPRYNEENKLSKTDPKTDRITDNGGSSIGSSLWLPLLCLPLIAMLSTTSGEFHDVVT